MLEKIASAVGLNARCLKLSNAHCLQKKELKRIHQEVWKESVADRRRDLAVDLLIDTADKLEKKGSTPRNSILAPVLTPSNRKVSEASGTVVVGLNDPLSSCWCETTQVKRNLYVAKVFKVINESILAWEKVKTPRKRKCLALLRDDDGKAAVPRLFKSSFFNDEVHGDPNEEISWKKFKSDVFYPYIESIDVNIRKLKTQIRAQKQIEDAFGDAKTLKLEELLKKLKDNKEFAVSQDFWNLSCWDKDFLNTETTYNEFIEKYMKSRPSSLLIPILNEFEKEQRFVMTDESLIVVKGTPSAPTTPRADIIEQDIIDEVLLDDSYGAKHDNLESQDTTSGFVERTQQIHGAPVKELIAYYNSKSTDNKRIAVTLQNIVNSVRENNSDNETMNARDLLRSATSQFKTLKVHLDTRIEANDQKYDTLMKHASPEKLEALKAELESHQKLFAEVRRKLLKDEDELLTLLKDNYNNYLINSYNKHTQHDNLILEGKWTLECKLLTPLIKEYQDAIVTQNTKDLLTDAVSVSEVTKLPKLVNYVDEFHEAYHQTDDRLGLLYAVIAIKEWQMFKNTESTKHLSVDLLTSLLIDYLGGESWADVKDCYTLLDVLAILKKDGITTQENFSEYIGLKNFRESRPVSWLRTECAKNRIQEYYQIKSIRGLKKFLSKHGPALATLPVYDKTKVDFWRKTKDEPEGYHTLVVTGYNSKDKTFFIRNSLGKEYGSFGNHVIHEDELLSLAYKLNTSVIGFVDGAKKL